LSLGVIMISEAPEAGEESRIDCWWAGPGRSLP
jgi:hypothetical protein